MTKRKTRFTGLAWRGALAAAWAIACVLPLPAQALGPGCQLGPAYTADKVSSTIQPLLPSIISLDKNAKPGDIVFQTPLPDIPYTCLTTGPDRPPKLSTAGGYLVIDNALKRLGIKLRLKINGYPDWEPKFGDELLLTASPIVDGKTTGVLVASLQAVMVTPPTKPIRELLPRRDALFQVGHYFLNTNRIEIGTSNDTNVSLIPTCIAKITTPPSVNLGRAYSVGNLPLPSPQRFGIIANYDTACDGGFTLSDIGSMVIPLKLLFMPEGNIALAPDNQGINLVNNEGTLNGFKLVIKREAAFPITFNQWHDSHSITATNVPLSMLYSAELQPTGAPRISGPFSQNVVVLVTFQ